MLFEVLVRVTYCILLFHVVSGWTIVPRPPSHLQKIGIGPPNPNTALSMGILDSLSGFLNDREGDFIKLDESASEYGPGPAIVLYNVPRGIEDSEFMDMLSDGAPKAARKGISLARVSSNGQDDNEEKLLSLSLQSALETIVGASEKTQDAVSGKELLSTDAGMLASTPVLLFSGFSDSEMLESYNILGGEIYQETGGQSSAACAKAVPNAMEKPLRQVLEEISGDHQDAMRDATPQ